MARKPSYAAGQMWLENEGALLGRLLPTIKTTDDGRVHKMYAGEAYLKWQRGPIPVLRPAFRRFCEVRPENVKVLRSMRLTRQERDEYERHAAELDRQEDLHNAKLELAYSQTDEQARIALEKIQQYGGEEAEWMEELAEEALRELGGHIQVGAGS